MKNLKILVMTVPSWNSKVGANSWASLLEDYGCENVANICIREEIPDSKVCSRYFCVSENRIIKRQKENRSKNRFKYFGKGRRQNQY